MLLVDIGLKGCYVKAILLDHDLSSILKLAILQ